MASPSGLLVHRPGPGRPAPSGRFARHTRVMLGVLFGDLADDGRINLRFLRPSRAGNGLARSVAEAAALAADLGAGRGPSVLFGFLPRRGPDGTAAGVSRATSLWADLDVDGQYEAVAARRRLASCPLPPKCFLRDHAAWSSS